MFSRSLRNALFLFSALSSVALSFEGEKQGFILGIGGGHSLSLYHNVILEDSYDSEREDLKMQGVPVQINALIGYAWDNKNAVFYSGHGTYYIYGDDNGISSENLGLLTYRRYLTSVAPSGYFDIGTGIGISGIEDSDEPLVGPALTVAGGYMFSPHYSVEMGLDFTSTSRRTTFYSYYVDLTKRKLSLYITVNALAF